MHACHIQDIACYSIYIILPLLFVECGSETFGNNCSSNCHCINETCNPINGTCTDGECKRGYKDDNCSTGMWYWWLIVISTYSTSNRYVYYSQDTDV